MSYLVVGDLHLTDQAKDAYRFGIFEWLRQQQRKYEPEATIILGDLTHQKDNHSSLLVNALIDNLDKLERPIYILRGNHDGIDPNTPYFKFINKIEGLEFFTKPTEILGERLTFIPHCRTVEEWDSAIEALGQHVVDYAFIHQTVEGAIAETGKRLTGMDTSKLKAEYGVYAGDIHRPQVCGNVTYVGSPYNIRFGDDFEPRCLLLDGKKATNLYFDCPRKWVLKVRSEDEILNNEKLVKGDHVKVNIELAREESVEWQKHKSQILGACAKLGLEVYGVEMTVATYKAKQVAGGQTRRTHKQTLDDFCTTEAVSSQIKKAGHRILGA